VATTTFDVAINALYDRGVELTQLRYVVGIAREGNLGRAALALHVSQPALSYALRTLESELGVRLFERHRGGVTPTPAGRDLVHDARHIVQLADRAIEVAAAHANGTAGVLRVGFEASGAAALTTRARATFARRFPNVRVEPKRFDWGGEAAALRQGLTDIAFVWLPNETEGMRLTVVHEEPRVVGVAASHRLADRGQLSILEINEEPLMWTRSAPRAWVDWWAVNPRPDGSEPRWGPTNDNVEEMLEQVAEGTAVCIAPVSMPDYYGRSDLRWITLTDVEPLQVALAWMPDHETPLIRRFAEVVDELTAT
jgi:DNA-binding transcriptional LysR family regulator